MDASGIFKFDPSRESSIEGPNIQPRPRALPIKRESSTLLPNIAPLTSQIKITRTKINLSETKSDKDSAKSLVLRCSVRNCDFTTVDDSAMLEHLKRHSNPKTMPQAFKCSICERTWTSMKGLKGHIETQHTKPRFTCRYCAENFPNEAQLKGHLSHEHFGFANGEYVDPKDRSYNVEVKKSKILPKPSLDSFKEGEVVKCEKCGYEAMSETVLLLHRCRVNKAAQWFKCPNCNFETKSPDQLNVHLRTHWKAWECIHCDYKATDAASYIYHLSQHTGYLLKCDTCSYCSLTPEQAQTHQIFHPPHPKFTCYNCRTTIDYEVHLKLHNKVYICPYCEFLLSQC